MKFRGASTVERGHVGEEGEEPLAVFPRDSLREVGIGLDDLRGFGRVRRRLCPCGDDGFQQARYGHQRGETKDFPERGHGRILPQPPPAPIGVEQSTIIVGPDAGTNNLLHASE